MTWPVYLVLALVTLQRLGELLLAERNTRRLLARGAHEVGRGHYPFMVAVHAGWLIALWLLGPGPPIHIVPLIIYAALQFARIWVIATLGERWTTRIIILPGEPLVRHGPYRWFDHPNYLIVIAEIAVLPLVFGLPVVAAFFSVLNAVVLWVRVREENEALAAHR
ncbi:MAG TPA: isoprenylcysteine carboxylmethyltransferase family protein [Sphingomicrobium sp.]|nr:isoprenylcysteine carboxylmethyltransferase family protein [Sphingomicrobium sp.]